MVELIIQRFMCLRMKQLPLVLLLLGSCSAEQSEYSWFQGDWISDAETSIAKNSGYTNLSESDLAVLREMYGRIRWQISDSIFRFIDDRYNELVESSTNFEVETIDPERFLMKIENESRIVWRTDSGFCTKLNPDYLLSIGIDGENQGLECFKPYGT